MIFDFDTLKLIWFLIICNAAICIAQSNFKSSPDKNFWLSSSMGIMGGTQYSGILADFSIAYSNKNNFYSIEYLAAADIGNFVIYSDTERNSLSGINLLYGTMKRASFYKVSYSFGLSVFEAYHSKRENDIFEKIYKYTVGVPLSTQLVLTPIRILAIGIKGYFNLNTENTLIGASIGLYFGKVK
jgi:hypothetical protein